MPGDYSAQAASALATIKAKGFEVLLTHPRNTVDPVTQALVKDPLETPVSAVKLPLTLSTKDVNVPKHLKKTILAKFLVAGPGVGFVPSAEDLITENGNTWAIFAVTDISPVGTPVLYTLYASR